MLTHTCAVVNIISWQISILLLSVSEFFASFSLLDVIVNLLRFSVVSRRDVTRQDDVLRFVVVRLFCFRR